MSDTVQALQETAELAARAAGKVLADKFQGERTIEYKAEIDLVTDADRASEAVLLPLLRARHPGHAILAEESGALQGQGYRWLVDPLDGTTNYAHGVPHFCVSIAVTGPGGLLAGVVFDPLRNELFSAGKGRGAHLNGRPLRPSAATRLDRALVCTGFPYDVRERPAAPVGLFTHFIGQVQGVRRSGSAALDLAYVASGRFDGFFEFGLKPWDVAAGALLAMESGAVVRRVDGAALDVEHGDVLACAPGIAEAAARECAAFLQTVSWAPKQT